MQIDIFDVGHGACSVLTAPNGKRIMIDCGYQGEEPYWWPSIHFRGQTIDALILSNLDEDHVGDFGELLRNAGIRMVRANETIDAGRLRSLKPDGMQKGVKAVYEFLRQPTLVQLTVDLMPMRVSLFRHPYGTFSDTNNLSLITFVQYGGFSILYPGDLEKEGWRAMLPNSTFQDLLRSVNIFVTSHHGRESGYCDEVFDICRPDAFIVSDRDIVYETQAAAGWYRDHAKGLNRIKKTISDAPETRYVFTTRNDGCLSVAVEATGTFILQTRSDRQSRESAHLGLLAALVPR